MQRQSLGSSATKHIAAAAAAAGGGNLTAEIKAEKPIRSGSGSSRSVHLIPILTLLCFLVLYLCSHEPSPSDLPSTRGIERILDRQQQAGSVASVVSAAIRNKRELMEETRIWGGRRMGAAP